MTASARFELLATAGEARRGRLVTPHGAIDTPAFTAGFTSQGVIFKSGPHQLHLAYRGASPATISGEDALSGHANFLLGNEPLNWRRDIPLYGKIRLSRLYPGRSIRAALIWTETPDLMEVPAADLDHAVENLTSP